MLKETERFQQALQLIIDGMLSFNKEINRKQAGCYLMQLLVADNVHLLDADKIHAIQSIMSMADE